MGPFVDATDGVTPETGITLGAADQAEVLKENGAATVAMGGTFAAITGADGWYDYTVATGDVDTVGEVVFVVQDSSVCLPVYVRAFVVEEAVYDLTYNGGAAGGATVAAQNTAQTDLDTLTDNRGHPAQGTPGTSVGMAEKVDWLYKYLVNKKTSTSSQLSVFNSDESTVDHKSTISDSAGTYTEGEWATGP